MPRKKSSYKAAIMKRNRDLHKVWTSDTKADILITNDSDRHVRHRTQNDNTQSLTHQCHKQELMSNYDTNDNDETKQDIFDIVSDMMETMLNHVIITCYQDPKPITKGKLKPGKVPYVRPRKRRYPTGTDVYINSVKQTAHSKTSLPTAHTVQTQKPKLVHDGYIPGKPRNIADFKGHLMPRSRPCSKPRSSRLSYNQCQVEQKTLKHTRHATDKIEPINVSTDHETRHTQSTGSVVQGSYHQGNPRYGVHSGKQCVANSFVAIIYSNKKTISTWHSTDLDNILDTGNTLYTYLQRSSTIRDTYMLVTELPHTLEVFQTLFNLDYGESYVGTLHPSTDDNVDTPQILSMNVAIATVLSQHHSMFMTYGGATFSVICTNDIYYIFDSHSRSTDGLQVPDGCSIVISYDSLHKVYEHCINLAMSMNMNRNAFFEVTGITVTPVINTDVQNYIALNGNDDSQDEEYVSHEIMDTSDSVSDRECATRWELPDDAENKTYRCSEADCISSGDMTHNDMYFHPITVTDCQNVCKTLAIPFSYRRELTDTLSGVAIGTPCTTYCVDGDGNCFFRCLSYAISGRENNHRKIRLAVVNHLKQHTERFYSFLRPEFNSVEQYIKDSRMWYVNTWATELEILASADFFGMDICTFTNNKWLRYSGNQITSQRSLQKPAIYLNHIASHYEVVTCIESVGILRQGCTNVHCSKSGITYTSRTHKLGTDYKGLKTLENDIDVERTTNGILHENITSKKTSQRKSDKAKCKREYIKAKRKCDKSKFDNEQPTAKKRKVIAQAEKYDKDYSYRQSKLEQSSNKYTCNKQHKECVITYSKEKYRKEDSFRQVVKQYSIDKYAGNAEYRDKVKNYSIKKYADNDEHRHDLKLRNKTKYSQDVNRKISLKESNLASTAKKQTDRKQMANVMRDYFLQICIGPECICTVCHRRLFPNQVIECKKYTYEKKSEHVSTIANNCITDTYTHICTNDCKSSCVQSIPWICFSCHTKLSHGKVPAEAVVNNLHLLPIPNDLQCLNELEQHLIALHIPFMKMMALPKGRQHGVHGPVVCVPANIQKSTSLLPRCGSDDNMIRIKLKRKLTYKSYYQYKFVNTTHIEAALTYLKRNNIWYKDINFNESWVNPLPVISEDHEKEGPDCLSECDSDNEESESTHTITSENEQEVTQTGLLMDTCLQPVDIGQEMLDQQFDNISCIAPAEDNNPVRLLMDKGNEAKAFPVLFPSGSPTFFDHRPERITLARYLHTRVMNADSRFAKNTDYIFYAQYLSELNQVMSNVSIALRKGICQKHVSNVTLTNLLNRDSLKQILKCDQGYKFLKPIRGTPPFWQSAQKDIFAMLRQLGIPTWFCSFSSADLRWSEVLEAIMREEKDPRKATDLDWAEKCYILRKNPVTAARMFDHRFNTFLKKVIMSPAHPIGKIKDYFYRVEFQQRGSPHTHCLFWVDKAPKINRDSDEAVINFIDKYVTCEMPSSEHDGELHDIVNTVQKHSRRHSTSCKKTGKTCRFHFPRPTSNDTFISRPRGSDVVEMTHDESKVHNSSHFTNSNNVMDAVQAKQLLQKVWSALEDEENRFETVDELFTSIGLSQTGLEEACHSLAKKTNIVLKRKPTDAWVNQYNADLIRCWNANMDIQYVVDAYSCVVYIISYISKSEREIGLLLNHAQKEANNKNDDARYALKKLGAVYLHNREISAQEAVFRVCNLKLKAASRKVQFIPTVNAIKMSLPLKSLKRKQESGEVDENDIWMKSIFDRYKNRPKDYEFDNMCLATFCSEYRVVYGSEVSKVSKKSKIVTLLNDYGYVRKRTLTEPAVVRYARFSPSKDTEKYHQSILELFLPHRVEEQLKPLQFLSFEDFYNTGSVQIGLEPLQSVKSIVQKNRNIFEADAEEIDKAQVLLEKCGPLNDAWAQICPETEVERLSCQHEDKERLSDDTDDETEKNIPDLMRRNMKPCSTELRQNTVSRPEAEQIFRSLNEEQSQFFYMIRQWCLDVKNGKRPQPFHVFVTGGAGTGKSHVIKAICYDATRIFAQCQDHPDDISVLLVAPTGVAAFNINAFTIHSAFSIGIDAILPYTPLGEEKINTMRAKLHSLQILIIDEISMVSNKLLTYIHGRLRQVKQTVDHSPFGKVSVIAVGDFHQLSPTMEKTLCIGEEGYNLWNDNFSLVLLTKIMRQKNPAFAQLLNRLRTKKKCDSLSHADFQMLKNCETGEDNPKTLHIFATNSQVDAYNVKSLHILCSDPICIKGQDFKGNAVTGTVAKQVNKHSNVHKPVLPKSLTIAVGARVVVIKNIETKDGLVNGAFGTVSNIFLNAEKTFPTKVTVVFDNEHVGQLRRKQEKITSKETPIYPEEEKLADNAGTRHQYPLKLSFACTIHRVQGLSIPKLCVCFKKIWAPGQAYVALSRVTSLDGLTIQGLNESLIYTNPKIEEAVAKLPKFITRYDIPPMIKPICTFILQNIEGLQIHIKDLQCDKRFVEADFLCLTETWLADAQNGPEFCGFTFHHQPRPLSYQSVNQMFTELKSQTHGGVGVYCSNMKNYQIPRLQVLNMEYIAFMVPEIETTIAVVYRPQSYKIDIFRETLTTLVQEVTKVSERAIIMGDFNEDIFSSSTICRLMESVGFTQTVTDATTESATLIDHVYMKGMDNISVHVLPTYFGYHEAIKIII